jgi:hypothetical protein
MEKQVVSAVLWAALEKMGSKLGERSMIADGSAHDVALAIEATIDGRALAVDASARVLVGHGGTRKSSVAVEPARVLGHVCELMALAFGDAEVLAVLEAIRAKFAGLGAVDASPEWVARAEEFAKSLRGCVTNDYAGAVRVDVVSCCEAVQDGAACPAS